MIISISRLYHNVAYTNYFCMKIKNKNKKDVCDTTESFDYENQIVIKEVF